MGAKPSASALRATGPKLCPICGKASYSRAGVHPQCSQHQADLEIKAHLKEEAKKAEAEADPQSRPAAATATRTWHKRCPECGKEVHVRQARCACGFTFAQ